MLNFVQGNRLVTMIVVLLSLALTPVAFAGEKEDVMAFVKKYADLENDLAAQAKLIRSDRVMITNVRQSDQAKNLEIQLASRSAEEAMAGGKVKFITTVESPQVAIYGNTAVASFMRMFSVYPHGQEPIHTDPTWVTLVLVKDGRSWGIAHTHVSAVTAN